MEIFVIDMLWTDLSGKKSPSYFTLEYIICLNFPKVSLHYYHFVMDREFKSSLILCGITLSTLKRIYYQLHFPYHHLSYFLHHPLLNAHAFRKKERRAA